MLTHWDAVSTLDRMFDDMSRSARRPATTARDFQPDYDVRTTDQDVTLVFDLPGVKREDVDITLHEHVLSIKGARKLGEKTERKFATSFTLESKLDESKLTAVLAEGVLTVRIPRQPNATPVKIEVK